MPNFLQWNIEEEKIFICFFEDLKIIKKTENNWFLGEQTPIPVV